MRRNLLGVIFKRLVLLPTNLFVDLRVPQPILAACSVTTVNLHTVRARTSPGMYNLRFSPLTI